MRRAERIEFARHLERLHLTIGIASVCHNGRAEAKIIACTDALVSGPAGKAQVMLKIRTLGPGWFALVAGAEEEINASIRLIKKRFTSALAAKTPVDETNAKAMVEDALFERKREKANELIRSQYAIGYDEFLASGKSRFPEDLFREAVAQVRDIDLGAEFIVAGFAGDPKFGLFPFLLETTTSGKVRVRDNFAAIGAGASLAESVLFNRAHTDVHPFGRVLYATYEAKKYAEGHTTVGDYTNLVVMNQDGSRALVNPETMRWLSQQYAQFGPKPIPVELSVPDGFEEWPGE